ncbi:MAG: AMIN domain-containing protein [Gammaproteobacteria bacterium]|uniref:N-acetylmuramoyl-L-alanine amidase n=1 Tax=Pseudomaricurvus alcaniphilus TaxID=1166482 RepID=UPI00140D83FC|nr:N-acetylmuramoyl-L-alanine amidase [Pseudomaricurvus alcaniphilus]MBR9909811.1 AMIN domain-containing protein [Gammaproteobacteria bacterium]NHN38537.1 AMIN domain-containing protein [Pseudomaricurvus alcaniphilus]
MTGAVGDKQRWNISTFVLLLCLLALLGSQKLQAAAAVEGLRIWRAPDHTRLVFDLSAPVEHSLFSLDNPERLVIDLKQTRLQADVTALALDKSPIGKVRTAVRHGSDLRVVLDLNSRVQPKSFFLQKHGDNDDRLVIDLFDQAAVVERTVAEVVPQSSSRRDIVIAIDAGHGGEDPGALGPRFGSRRIQEKDVVLAISQQLAALINREKGYKAELVRTGDYYIPLRKRRDRARELRADLFVSIHADAFKHHQANGASVYALSRSGATSETARFLAEKENEADLIGGVGSVSLDDKDEVLRGVLVDLSMTATLGSSLQVGERVLKSMDSVARLHKQQVEQAGFAVLKSPDVPSILVETGFISNPDEAKKLNSQFYRQSLANSIFKGIKEHFYAMPPAGTYIAWQKNGGDDGSGQHVEYVIAKGDTLSTIARRYDVSVSQLLKVNGLSGSTIRVGQRLLIPTS